MSVLIAGASGFIGVNLVNYLLLNGYSITVLTRNKKTTSQNMNPLVNVEQWPASEQDYSIWQARSYDVIINLAGENIGTRTWTKKYKENLISSRINAISQLNKLVNVFSQPPKVWVQASAIGYYGCKVLEYADENSEIGKGFLAQLVDKWEQAFWQIDLKTTRKVIFRLGVVFSPKGGFLQQITKTIKFGFAVCPGSGKQNISYIHINDLIRIFHQSMKDNRFEGAVNIVATKPFTMKEIINHFQQKNQVWAAFHLPKWLLNLLFGKEKVRELILADQLIEPDFLKKVGYNFLHPTISNL